MRRFTFWRSNGYGAAALMAVITLGAVTAARSDEVSNLPAEVRQIQQALGGPAVNQYQELRPTAPPAAGRTGRRQHVEASATPLRMQPTVPAESRANWTTSPAGPWNGASPATPDRRTMSQAGALREAAAHLDGSANRLESLDLYHQADAMRTLAQRLRLGARAMLRGPQGAGERPAQQVPSSWSQPGTTLAPALAPAAQLAPAIEPTPVDPN